MSRPFAVASLAVVVLAGASVSPSDADDPGPDVTASPSGASEVLIHGERTLPGDESGGATPADGGPAMETYISVEDDVCRSPREVFLAHYQRPAGPDEPWELVSSGCELPGIMSPGVQPGGRVLTPDDVREAVRRIGLPASTLEVPIETLVNYDTTVYTSPVTFARTVTLLGSRPPRRDGPTRPTTSRISGRTRIAPSTRGSTRRTPFAIASTADRGSTPATR